MRTPDVAKALSALADLLKEKRVLVDKEHGVIDRVNRAMGKTGYQLVATGKPQGEKRRGRPRGSRNKTTKGKMHETSSNGVATVPRRRGRPPLKRIA